MIIKLGILHELYENLFSDKMNGHYGGFLLRSIVDIFLFFSCCAGACKLLNKGLELIFVSIPSFLRFEERFEVGN